MINLFEMLGRLGLVPPMVCQWFISTHKSLHGICDNSQHLPAAVLLDVLFEKLCTVNKLIHIFDDVAVATIVNNIFLSLPIIFLS